MSWLGPGNRHDAAEIDLGAMRQPRDRSRSHHAPAHMNPLQSDYRISVLAPDDMESKGYTPHAAKVRSGWGMCIGQFDRSEGIGKTSYKGLGKRGRHGLGLPSLFKTISARK